MNECRVWTVIMGLPGQLSEVPSTAWASSESGPAGDAGP